MSYLSSSILTLVWIAFAYAIAPILIIWLMVHFFIKASKRGEASQNSVPIKKTSFFTLRMNPTFSIIPMSFGNFELSGLLAFLLVGGIFKILFLPDPGYFGLLLVLCTGIALFVTLTYLSIKLIHAAEIQNNKRAYFIINTYVFLVVVSLLYLVVSQFITQNF